jgi:hypothetical protein
MVLRSSPAEGHADGFRIQCFFTVSCAEKENIYSSVADIALESPSAAGSRLQFTVDYGTG